jgi:hypothetical protein
MVIGAMSPTPVLDRDEYVEQAYFFRMFRERLLENQASQEILSRVHEEILSTTRLPYAIQFLATELKHTGLLADGFRKLPHYFTPFQAYVIDRAETEKQRFSIQTALLILEGEARYRADHITPAGLFVYQFEVLSRNRLGYNDGLAAMAQEGCYDDDWREYMETVRRNVGEVEFSDLVYVRSELYIKDQLRLHPGADLSFPRPLFAEKEGKIAKASHGRDPLFLFAALQRQLGYPAVPRQIAREDPQAKLQAIQAKLRELELRIKLVESEARGQIDMTQFLGKPELLRGDDD